jgi:molybdopterin-guanine dinucleotide biosynthesis protein A
MGRDKAFLEVDRQPLWRLQLAKLRAVCGEVVVCGSTSQRGFFEPEGVRFEADVAADLGPLSGIARALESAQATHVLVLAVDMPRMSERYLFRLREAAGPLYGVVPERAGAFEGLCAVYPASIYPLVSEQLSGSDRSLQALVRSGVERNLLRPFPIIDPELGLFENWNVPGDLAPLVNSAGA